MSYWFLGRLRFVIEVEVEVARKLSPVCVGGLEPAQLQVKDNQGGPDLMDHVPAGQSVVVTVRHLASHRLGVFPTRALAEHRSG